MWHHDEREKKKTSPTPQKLEKIDTIIPWFRPRQKTNTAGCYKVR